MGSNGPSGAALFFCSYSFVRSALNLGPIGTTFGSGGGGVRKWIISCNRSIHSLQMKMSLGPAIMRQTSAWLVGRMLLRDGLEGRIGLVGGTCPRWSGRMPTKPRCDPSEIVCNGQMRRERQSDPRPHLFDAACDLHEGRADCLERRPAPARLSRRRQPHRMQEPVGAHVQEEAKLIGLPPMACGLVGEALTSGHGF